jgi:hypothetical protein
MFMAPALLIALPLTFGVYPGEAVIARYGGPVAQRSRKSTLVPSPSHRPVEGLLPRGARLIAFSLAKRPPPRRALLQT